MIRVFVGEDTYRSRAAYVAAREDAQKSGPLTVLRDEDLTPERFTSVIRGQSLFGGSTVVAVEDLTQFTGSTAEAIAERIAVCPSGTTLLVWERGRPQERLIVWKALKKHAKTIEQFPPPSSLEMRQIAESIAKDYGGTLDRSALDALVSGTAGDIWRLVHEVEKLCLLVTNRPATREDVERLSLLPLSSDVFAAVRSITGNDPASAIRHLVRERAQGSDPRMLLSLVIRDIRTLLILRDRLDRRERLTAWGVARDMHLPAAAADALIRTAGDTTTVALRRLFDRLVVALHALNTGRADPEDILDGVVFQNIEIAGHAVGNPKQI